MNNVHPGKVLIVDDDEFVVEILTAYFESETPWIIHRCNNGNDVLSTVTSICPHIILLDLRLPDVDGLELIHRLKNENGISDIPVIVISGHDDLFHKRQALKAGAARYLSKPIHPAVLKDLLEKYIPGPPQA